MKLILIIELILITLLNPFDLTAQKYDQATSDKINSEDLKSLLGEWKGSLTYIDYSSGEPYTMPVLLTVKKGKNEDQYYLYYNYPNEPKANNKEKIKISGNGLKLNGKAVRSRELLPNGQLQITTEYSGKDDKRNALIRNIYIIGNENFVIRKEIKFSNSQEWIKRNEYSFKK